MKRQLSIVGGILIIVAGVFGKNMISDSKKGKRPPSPKEISTVFTETVKNTEISISINESGRLTAKNRANLYAEVQGVMEQTNKEFKPGIRFKKGESLVKIRSDEAYVKLLAQKSVLQNLVTSILPDLRLDYPEAYQKWNTYVSQFNIDKPIADLPKTTSDKEKYFITGKNIYTTYYNTKNLEIIQRKYRIRAPFNGILTETLANPGTVIRPGQKLGEIIDPSIYELEVALSQSILPALSIGTKVKVTNPNDSSNAWTGKVTRINGKVESTTQTVKVFINVKGKNLKEGIYLEAEINGNKIPQAYEFDRKLLIEGKKIFVLEDDHLKLVPVTILHKTNRSVITQSLKSGTIIISKIVPGAFDGMKVKVYNKN